MKIGMMCHSSVGGSVRIATELSSELALRGHRVHVFSRTTPFGRWDPPGSVVLHTSTPDHENIIDPSILYTDWPEKEFQAFLSNVLDVIIRDGLDLIHFHYAVPFAFVLKEIKERLGNRCPCLFGTLHGSDVSEYGRDPVKGPLLARALGCLDGLSTVSTHHASLAKEVFDLLEPPEIIPNFIPFSGNGVPNGISASSRKLERELGAESRRAGRPIIAHVSNFRPVKDLMSVVSIFMGIRERIDAELWLIGDGQEMAKITPVLHGEGLTDHVRYWGMQRDVAPILVQTDLLLMASLSESFGLCALEAMACGVPVLATHVGGLPEVVVHGKTGFLFPVGNHPLAIDFAVRLLEDPSAHRYMRRAAVNRAHTFTKGPIVSLYEGLYAAILQKKRVPSACRWEPPVSTDERRNAI